MRNLAIILLFFAFSSQAQTKTYPVVNIYMDGDSTTWGTLISGGTPSCSDGASTTGCVAETYGHNVAGNSVVAGQATYNEPAEVQLQMNAAFGVGDVVVANHGVPGATILDSINGSSDPISGAAEYDCTVAVNVSDTCGSLGVRLQASHAQIVIGHFLTNDQYRMTPAEFGSYVTTWIDTVQALENVDGNPMVAVIEESAPICRADAPNVGPYLDALRTAAASSNILLVSQHDWIYANLDWKPMLADCVHPDNGLYATMGDRLATSVALTVQTLLGHPGI